MFLSTGVITRIMDGENVPKPVLQILAIKRLVFSTKKIERYRILISDGKYFCDFAMLVHQLNEIMHKGELDEFAIVQLDNYMITKVTSETPVLVIVELKVLNMGRDVQIPIGKPISYRNAHIVMGPPATTLVKKNRLCKNKSNRVAPSISRLNPYQNKPKFNMPVFCKTAVPSLIMNKILNLRRTNLALNSLPASYGFIRSNPGQRAARTKLRLLQVEKFLELQKFVKLNTMSLSTGVIARIMHGEDVPKPVLQILAIKRINSNSDSERYRVLISDGKYFNSYAMLATQLNQMQHNGELDEFTIVQLDKYMTSMVGKEGAGKRVLIITELKVLKAGGDVNSKIGEPVTYENAAKQDTAPKPMAPPSTSLAKKEPLHNNNNNNNSTMNTSLNAGLTHPISSLSPYQNKWVIKARVTSKTAIRTWNNARGEGKLFSMDLLDESGEIRATAFKEQCDKFFDLIQVDSVYYFSKCQLKPANKQYSQLKNDYEMTFTGETVVQLCEDAEDSSIPEIKYDLVPISQVANMEDKASVDTIGICKEVGELQAFTSRTTNKEFKKRDLTLVDMSNAAINLTLWGDDAVNFDGHVQPVILVKGTRINEFNGGKSISLGGGSIMKINPDIPEAHKLRGWFDNGGGDNIATMVSARTGGGSFSTDWMTLKEARMRNLGAGDKPDYFQCKAVVHIVKQENAFYKACPQSECNKKVVDEGNGMYRCERCNQEFPNFKYRLLVNLSIGDWTSNRWVTCFSEIGEQLLRHSAQEVGEALENDPTLAEQMFSAMNFTSHIFKLRCKNEVYGDMTRNKLTVQSVAPVNHKEYNKYLLKELQQLTGIGTSN